MLLVGIPVGTLVSGLAFIAFRRWQARINGPGKEEEEEEGGGGGGGGWRACVSIAPHARPNERWVQVKVRDPFRSSAAVQALRARCHQAQIEGA